MSEHEKLKLLENYVVRNPEGKENEKNLFASNKEAIRRTREERKK